MNRRQIILITMASMFLVTTIAGIAGAGPRNRAAYRMDTRVEVPDAVQERARVRAHYRAAIASTPFPGQQHGRWEDRVDRRGDRREDVRDRREDRREGGRDRPLGQGPMPAPMITPDEG